METLTWLWDREGSVKISRMDSTAASTKAITKEVVRIILLFQFEVSERDSTTIWGEIDRHSLLELATSRHEGHGRQKAKKIYHLIPTGFAGH